MEKCNGIDPVTQNTKRSNMNDKTGYGNGIDPVGNGIDPVGRMTYVGLGVIQNSET